MTRKSLSLSLLLPLLFACGDTETRAPTDSTSMVATTTTSTTPPACGCTVADPGCMSPSYACAAAGFLGGGCSDGQWCAPCGGSAQCRERAKPGEACDPAVNISCAEDSSCNAAGVCSGGVGCTTPGADGIPCGDGGVCHGGLCVDGAAP